MKHELMRSIKRRRCINGFVKIRENWDLPFAAFCSRECLSKDINRAEQLGFIFFGKEWNGFIWLKQRGCVVSWLCYFVKLWDLIHCGCGATTAMFKLNFRLIHAEVSNDKNSFFFLPSIFHPSLCMISITSGAGKKKQREWQKRFSRRKKSFRCHKTHTGHVSREDRKVHMKSDIH